MPGHLGVFGTLHLRGEVAALIPLVAAVIIPVPSSVRRGLCPFFCCLDCNEALNKGAIQALK
jgi:hypothetical protein